MGYDLFDVTERPIRFLGDLASIGGWRLFTQWAARDGHPEIEHFIEHGHTTDPAALAAALRAVDVDPTVAGVRQRLLAACEQVPAPASVVLSDGTEPWLIDDDRADER